jgi:diguanylate cyclase (GGDEF)-like protein
MGDIDDFKVVHDTHGRTISNAMIMAIARVLQSSLREEQDSCYRYGGDEFAVLMRNTAEEQAHLMMSRISAKIAGTSVPASEFEISVTMSIGIGQFTADFSGAEFLSRVERALSLAKDGGKNRISRLSELPPRAGESH